MMKYLFLLPLLASQTAASCSTGAHASAGGVAKAKDGHNYHEKCIRALRSQVRKEFEASLQYLLMGAYFGQDNVALDGFSEMFFEHADEERQHGIKFIEYLRMRGDADTDFLGRGAITPILGKVKWEDGEEALRDALDMEKAVTASIKALVEACDNDELSDFHAADWLSGDWLEEQLQGQRQLAGMVNTMATFRRDHEQLADWMFDQQIKKMMAEEKE